MLFRSVDAWASTAYTKIVTSRRRFPAHEAVFTVNLAASTVAYTDPTRRITGVFVAGYELKRVFIQDLKAQATVWTGTPTRYAVYGGQIHVNPTPTEAAVMTVLGARKGSYVWLTDGTAVDLPDQYGTVVQAWVLSEAYKHAQDIPMANNFAVDFETALQSVNASHIDPPDSWVGNSVTPGEQW